MVRLILAAAAVLLAAVAGFVGYRAYSFTAPAPPAEAAIPDLASYDLDASAAARHLAEAIRFRTVSLVSESDDPAPFLQFQAWMQQTYPAFHAATRRDVIGELSLLYTWEGADPAQPPILLLAHQDVVPVPEDTLEQWVVDPFAGVERDDAIWGRGSIDDKGSLVGLLEAAELLAARGWRPTRTIMFAFGHDEEIGGDGAQAIAAELQRRGVRAWFVLDEGMVTLASHPLTNGPASMIGVSEKGFATLRIHAVGQPGHSSMPPPETAVSLVAEAVGRVHDMPIDRRLEGGPALDMMRALAPELPTMTRVAVANEWLFAPILRRQMADSPPAMALLGTTVAPTVISGGSRANVLPGEAEALINFRVHPRDTPEGLLARAREAVGDMEGVTLDWVQPPNPASAVSSTTSSSYALIAALTRAAMPEAPVAPALDIAGTDSRYYEAVAENTYRFQPILLTDDNLKGPHGLNEHISRANFERLIRFYVALMEAGATQ